MTLLLWLSLLPLALLVLFLLLLPLSVVASTTGTTVDFVVGAAAVATAIATIADVPLLSSLLVLPFLLLLQELGSHV